MEVNTISRMDLKIFQASPGISVVLRPTQTGYNVVAASDDFLTFSGVSRSVITGSDYLQFMRENIPQVFGDGEKALVDCFRQVLEAKVMREIRMATSWNAAVNLTVKVIPVCDDDGRVAYIIQSVSPAGPAGSNVQAMGMKGAYRFFLNAPVIIGYLSGDDYLIEFANEALLKVWKRSDAVIGKHLFAEFPEFVDQGIKKLLDDVRTSGKPFFAYEFPITFSSGAKEQTLYFDFVYHPYYETGTEKVATGIISVGHDVTEKVRAKQKFHNVIEQTQNPILILSGENMVVEAANQAILDLWDLKGEPIGRELVEIRPYIRERGFLQLLQQVYRTGLPFTGFGAPVEKTDDKGQTRTVYYNYTYQPYREANGEIVGVTVMASDATEQILAKKQLEESQRIWKSLANTMPAIVWMGGADGEANFFNQRWYEFTGLTEEESLGLGWTKVLHPDDVERCKRAWHEAQKTESFYEVEVRYRNKEGQYRWVMSRGVPIRDDRGVSWYGTSTDIHEHKEFERRLEDIVNERTAELAAKNILLDNILRNSSNGISVSEMIFDEKGNVVDAMTIMANDAAIAFAGIPREVYLTKRATEVDPAILSSPYGLACLNTLTTGEPSIMRYFLDYSKKWLELTVSRMDDSHLIHIFTDVTTIKQTQLELERSLEDIKFANANLEEFAYAASHDLKEPVRKIQYFSNQLKDALADRINAKELNLFERLETSAGRMEKLIDDLLEYSQSAKGTSVRVRVDLNAVIRGVMDDLEVEVQRKKATITAATLPAIEGNPRQIQQLFQNLISNALKYSRSNVAPEITITSKTIPGKEFLPELAGEMGEKRFHLVEVSDNGIGFDQHDAEKMFNLFMRLHSDVAYRGSGIGLSIVKKVVESHHGFIRARSERGKGATFSILLPVG